MGAYKKPEVMETADLFEGVYLASGSNGGDSGKSEIVCQSKYLKGEWRKPNRGMVEKGPALEKCGCEGCSADDGDGCKILKGGELNPNGVFKPTWEQEGKKPDTMVW